LALFHPRSAAAGTDFDVAFVAMKAYDSLLARSLLDAVALGRR